MDHTNLKIARDALEQHHPADVSTAVAIAQAHALVSIADSLASLNRTLERIASEDGDL